MRKLLHAAHILVHPTLGGDFEMPLAETLGQRLTRLERIGDQEIPWQVASPQCLPPLLLAVVLQQIDVSLGKSGTSE